MAMACASDSVRKMIARAMGISKRTVDNHMANIHGKMGTSSRAELMGM